MSETETVVEKKEEVKDSESSANVAESAQKSEAVTETVKEVKTDTDGWTIRTVDGEDSAHFEHTIAITKNGPIILSQSVTARD